MGLVDRGGSDRLARDPDIALTILGGDKVGIPRWVSQFSAQSIDQKIDAALAGIRPLARNSVEKLISRDNEPRPLAQSPKNCALGTSKGDFPIAKDCPCPRKIWGELPLTEPVFVFAHQFSSKKPPFGRLKAPITFAEMIT